MSFFEFCEQALRGVAFLTQIITFVILHILEMSFRPLYYPLFGAALKKFLGHEPVDFLTFAFAKTFMKVIEVKIIPVNLVF